MKQPSSQRLSRRRLIVKSSRLFVALSVLSIGAHLSAGRALGETTYWIAPDFGDWGYSENWSPFVPTGASTEIAVIGNFGVAEVRETDAIANNILIGPDENRGDLVVNASLGPATLTARNINVAYGSESVGILSVDGAGSTVSVNALTLGGLGNGAGFITNGGRLEASKTIRVGSTSSADGRASVSGAGSQLTAAEQLQVGYEGAGELEIEDGGWAGTFGPITGGDDGLVFVGTYAGSSGKVTVKDFGAQLIAAGSLLVGQEGEGDVSISAGGFVSSHPNASPDSFDATLSGGIGSNATGHGTVTITDAGSRWTQDGTMAVGYSGQGELTVLQGGRLESLDGHVARNVGSQGTVTIAGAESVWAVEDKLTVGGSEVASGGTGSVTISNLGAVTVPNLLKLWSNGSVDVSGNGIVNIGMGAAPAGGVVRVGTGGTLAGNGTIVGNVLNESGTVAPGSSAGALHVNGNFTQAPGSTLQVELGGTTLGSQYDHLDVAGALSLAGTLDVALINDFVPSAGQSFNILDWFGTRTGTFSIVDLPTLTGLVWDTSHLYDMGVLTLAAAGLPGDYNQNGTVDAADYTVWRDNLGSLSSLPNDDTAGVDQDDYDRWKMHFGETNGMGSAGFDAAPVPEPSSLALVLAAAGLVRRRPARSSPNCR